MTANSDSWTTGDTGMGKRGKRRAKSRAPDAPTPADSIATLYAMAEGFVRKSCHFLAYLRVGGPWYFAARAPYASFRFSRAAARSCESKRTHGRGG